MSIPAFTATAALRRIDDRHYGGNYSPAHNSKSFEAIFPQNVPCDIAIRCIDGVRYMTTDCPDGSGDTIAIGSCSEIAARPWRPLPRIPLR
jgi:hypothetical protein